jgi:hypothetical protein
MPPARMMLQQMQATIGIDIIYSFVIILSALLIYHATKELFELTGHKGIKYFRRAFLFFALAYFFRFITQFLVLYVGVQRSTRTQLGLLGFIALDLFMYALTVAILYLAASVHSRKFEKKKYLEPILHIIAIIVTIVSVATSNLLVLLTAQLVVIIALALTIYYREKQTKKKSQRLLLLYTLLAIFWALNTIDLIIPSFFALAQLLIYIASIGIFLFLLYRVTKKTGP